MADCPLCGSDVQKGDLDIVREFERGIARARAAEDVAKSLWDTTDALRFVLDRKSAGRSGDWDFVNDLRDALDELRRAQQVFRDAAPGPLI